MTLKERIEKLENLLDTAKSLDHWLTALKSLREEIATLGNSGRVEIVFTDTEDIDYRRTFSVPVHVVRGEIEKLGFTAMAKVEQMIADCKMD